MKKKITLMLLLASIVTFSQSINYKNASSKIGSNFYEIVAKKRAEIKNLHAKKVVSRSDIKAMKHFERWAYYWRDRVNADGSFPSALEGWKNAGLLGGKSVLNQNQSKLSQENWTNIGPQSNPDANGYPNPPKLGRLNAFWRYVNAGNANNNVLIVGAPTGGIWKSIDNGATWSPKFDTFAGIGITDIKGSSTSTTSPGVLYATTGDYDGLTALNSIGVYKSTDMGESWTATGLNLSLTEEKLLGHLVVIDDNTVVAATANDIMRTADGGATWNSVYTLGGGNVYFGRMAAHGSTIVATDAYEGVYFSTDHGINWTEMISANAYGKYAVTADENGNFFIQDKTGQIKALSLAGAGSVTNVGIKPADYDPQWGYNQVLVKRNGFFLEGSVNANSSNDNGASWYTSLNGYKTDASDPGVYVHPDHHQAGYLDEGLSFWSANDGGLYFINYSSPTDQSPTTVYKSNGVVVTQIYTISINPSSGNNDDFMMANQDNDGFSKENGTWVSVEVGDGVCSAIDYTNSGIRYLGGQYGYLTRSDNTGYSGNFEGNPIPTPADGEFVWPFSLHTSTSTTAFGGFDDLYKSTNISTTMSQNPNDIWTKLNAGVGSPTSFDNQGEFIAVVGTDGISQSSNGGNSWIAMTQPAGQLVNSFSIDAASTSGNTIYATVVAYNANNKVFKSTNGGATWTNISGDLPNILMKKILFKQNQSSEYLFVGTELGVYFSINGGTNWSKLGANLPNVIVNDLKINYLNDKLYIGTYGRGLWEINIANETLGTEEVGFDTKPTIYPNPVNDNRLNVRLSSMNAPVDYVIYNVVGGVVSRGTFKQIENKVALEHISKGMYILKLSEGNKVFTHKFVVQ
jgi:xyloglucan-specific exo-beta-1,4-glucanase